jgi:hypothetical protein
MSLFKRSKTMSIRDQKQKAKRGNQDSQAVNLAAIAQHQAKTDAQIQKEAYGNPGGLSDVELQRSLNPQPIQGQPAPATVAVTEVTPETQVETVTRPTRIYGETESSPGLDALNNSGQVPFITFNVLPTTTNTPDANPEEQNMEQTNKEVVVAWVKENSTINTENLINLNLSTMTGEWLVNELALPTTIPEEVVTALLAEIATIEALSKYTENLPTMVKLIANEQNQVVTSKALDLLLMGAKPYITKLINKWDNLVGLVNSFLKAPEPIIVTTTTVPVTDVPETIAQRCKRIQAEADEKRKLVAQGQQPQIPQVQPTTHVAKLGNLIDKPKQPTMGDLVAEQAGHKSILDIMAERKQ